MKAQYILALALGISAAANAQSAIDAYTITPSQLRGTARFVAMGGAFTSLGGDLSSMHQNPAGLGIYRHSDIGLTFDVSIRNYAAATNAGKYSLNETLCKFDNFGYVGAIKLNGSTLKYLQWGLGYSRLANLDRITAGYNNPTGTSLSNYVAGFTSGAEAEKLLDSKENDPFFDTDEDWLSIMAYNSFMINSQPGSNDRYAGLYQNGTAGDALYRFHERGYTDEYSINLAGNLSDVVYWGLGVGIVDMSYSREGFYSESMENALVYETHTNTLVAGNAGFDLYNNRYVSGTGANIKLGVIVRPVDMLRVGLAFHTPTWMHLRHNGYADIDFNYTPGGVDADRTQSGSFSSPEYEYRSRLSTPWRFMAGASLTVGSSAIVSLDYERVAYDKMKMKEQAYGMDSYLGGSFVDNKYANADIKEYFKAANIIRAGVEYRLNKHVSLRAGYSYQASNVTSSAANTAGSPQIYTSGTDPSYRFDKDTQNICFGFGYRYGPWYADLTYQHTRQTGTFHAYTPYDGTATPSAGVTDTHNNIVFSTGFRF